MTQKTIYTLKENEILKINKELDVIKVPGGWLYVTFMYGEMSTSFVPYNEEYKKLT